MYDSLRGGAVASYPSRII